MYIREHNTGTSYNVHNYRKCTYVNTIQLQATMYIIIENVHTHEHNTGTSYNVHNYRKCTYVNTIQLQATMYIFIENVHT